MTDIIPTSPVSPVSKKLKAFKSEINTNYRFEIVFNEKAELVHINYPSDLSLAKVLNHLAVASLYLAQKVAEGENK
jgi:hypothetical protein